MPASVSVTTLAAMIGGEAFITPNAIQSATPVQNATYMGIEMPVTSRVRTARTTCGTNESVVREAATQPISSIRART